MEEKKRARRRRDKLRMKDRAVRIYTRLPSDTYSSTLEERVGNYRRLGDHITSCSCWGCGNPRRWMGDKTLQERRFECSLADDDGE